MGLILFSTFITSLSFWVEIFRMNCYLLNAAKELYRDYIIISLWENRFFILEVVFFTALLISCVEMVCKSISFRWIIHINMDENAAYSRLFVGFVLLLCDFVIYTLNLPLCSLDCRCHFPTLVWCLGFNTTPIVAVVAT